MSRTKNPRHEKAFLEWYADEDRSCRKVAEKLGYKLRTVERWRDKDGWRERAERLDDQARIKSERDLIKRQAEMLKHHGEIAGLVVNRAAEWFTNNVIENARDATSAFQTAVKIERESVGLPADMIWTIGKMSDDELIQFIAERARAASGSSGVGEAARPIGSSEPDDPGVPAQPDYSGIAAEV